MADQPARESALGKAVTALDEALDLMTGACGDLIEAGRVDLVVRVDGAYGLVATLVKEVKSDG